MKPSLQDVLKKYQNHPEFLGTELVYANQRGAMDDTVLHIAARKNEVLDLEVLVANGADINMVGDLGNTPLHNAALTGKEQAIRRLLDLGADPSLRNEFDQTPLDIAKVGNHMRAAAILEEVEKGRK